MKIELIYGTEPYLVREYREDVVKGIAMPDLNILVSGQFTDAERDFARQAPFFAERKVLILELEKLSASDMLEKYLKDPSERTELYIFAKDVDRRLGIYKKFPKDGIRQFDKEPGMLRRWVSEYVAAKGCRISASAYNELVSRIHYDLDDVSLYHVKAALEKLCSTADDITPELVARLVAANEKEDVFSLIELIDRKETEELFRQADIMLRGGGQNVIGTLSLLLRSYRILYKLSVCGCTLKEVGVHYRTYVPRLSGRQADAGVDVIQDVINGIKSGRYMPDFGLRFCFARLCQIRK